MTLCGTKLMSTARRSMACLKHLVSDQVYDAYFSFFLIQNTRGSINLVLSLLCSLVSVGFEYESCPDLILWEKRTAVLQGYETTASKLGGWTIDKHHALNIQSGESTCKPFFPFLFSAPRPLKYLLKRTFYSKQSYF